MGQTPPKEDFTLSPDSPDQDTPDSVTVSTSVSLSRGSLLTFGSKGFLLFLRVVTGMITARILAPEGRGILQVVSQYPDLFFIVGYLSLTIPILRYFGLKEYRPQSFAGNALIAALVVSVVLAAIFFCTYLFFPDLLYRNTYFPYLLLAFSWLPFMLFISYFSAILQALGRLKEYNVIQVMGRVVGLVLVILFLVILRWGVAGVLWTNTIAFILAGLLALLYVRRQIPGPWTYDAPLMRKCVKDSLLLHPGTIAVFIFVKFNILMINHYRTAEEVGYFTIAVLLLEVITYIPLAIQTALYPRTGGRSMQEVEDLVGRSARHCFYFTIAMAAAMALLGKWAILLYGGKAYLPAYQPLLIMVPGLIFMSISSSVDVLFIRKGLLLGKSVVCIFTAALNIVLNLYWIPVYGIAGAAWSTTICYFANTVLCLAIIFRKSNLTLAELFVWRQEDTEYYHRLYSKYFGRKD